MATNGQLVFTDVDKVTFKGVGDTSNAVIDTTTGKIGVGVDSPDANLHVLGNCFVSTNFELGGTMTMGTVTVRAQHELSAITATGNTTPHTVEFQNATTGLVTTGNVSVGGELAVSGNVAVGTNKLFVDTVGGTVGIGSTLIDITDNTLSGAGNGLYIHNPVQGGHLLTLGTQRPWVFEQGLSDASTQLCLRSLNSGKKFNIQSPDHSNVMTVVATNGGGNVGIGTDSPDNALHIRNAIPAVLLDDSDDDTKVRISGGAGGDLYVDSNWGGSGNTGDIIFREASSEKMRIAGNGNVGIGTSIPSSIFNTYGGALWDGSSMSSKVCATLQVGRGGGTGSAANDTGFGGILEFRHHSDSRFVTIESVSEAAYSASIGLSFKTHGGTGDGERMRIAGNGNVGIGTTSPGSTLDVHGTGIHIDGTVLRSYSSIGAMTAGTWYKVCDFSALPATVAGVCAIRIKWGGGSLTNVGTYYWSGYASGIVSYNTYNNGSGTYTAAPQEPLTLNQHYHHRAAGAFEFMLDGDASGGSYGYQSIYIKSPQELSSLSLEVIAMPLRR